jgi:hypothetical protein
MGERAEQLVAIINDRGVTDSAVALHRGPADRLSIVPGCGAGRVRRGEADEAKSLAARVEWMRKSSPTSRRLDAGYCGDRGVEQVEKPPSLWRFRLKIHRRRGNRKGLTAGRTAVVSASLGSCAPTRVDSSGQPLLGQEGTTDWSRVDCSEANRRQTPQLCQRNNIKHRVLD